MFEPISYEMLFIMNKKKIALQYAKSSISRPVNIKGRRITKRHDSRLTTYHMHEKYLSTWNAIKFLNFHLISSKVQCFRSIFLVWSCHDVINFSLLNVHIQLAHDTDYLNLNELTVVER